MSFTLTVEDPVSDHDAVLDRHKRFLASFASEDYEVMRDFLTKDHVGMPPNRPRMHGRDDAEAFWREGFELAESSFSSHNQTIEVNGDTATDVFDFVMTIKPRDGSPALEDHCKCVWLWRRDADGTWRLACAIWNSDLDVPKLWSGG